MGVIAPKRANMTSPVPDAGPERERPAGWRIGGHPAWLHAWVGDRAIAYGIDPQRSADALERVIGADGSSVMSHGGGSATGSGRARCCSDVKRGPAKVVVLRSARHAQKGVVSPIKMIFLLTYLTGAALVD